MTDRQVVEYISGMVCITVGLTLLVRSMRPKR